MKVTALDNATVLIQAPLTRALDQDWGRFRAAIHSAAPHLRVVTLPNSCIFTDGTPVIETPGPDLSLHKRQQPDRSLDPAELTPKSPTPADDFERRYQRYLEKLRNDHTLDPPALQVIEQELRRLNHDFEHADIAPARRVALLQLRNRAMTELATVRHRTPADQTHAKPQPTREMVKLMLEACRAEERAQMSRTAEREADLQRRRDLGRDLGMAR